MTLIRRLLPSLLLLVPGTALAADPAPMPDGAYVGFHAGYLFGTATATLADPIGGSTGSGTNAIGTLFGGVQAGYEHIFPSRLMLGIEADVSFTDFLELTPVFSQQSSMNGSANEQLEYLATVRGRLGYNMGTWTPFVSGGLALAAMRTSLIDNTTGNEDATPNNLHLGFAFGAGIDYALDRRWTARLEYLYTHLGLTGFSFASAPASYNSEYDIQRFRVGLNYHFGVAEDDKKSEERADNRGPGTWEIHGQSTFIYQGYPAFAAAYDGPQSLPSIGQARETWTGSVFLGVRLWQGGELYYNPELLQGFGLADTTGAAGFPNGEAQKSNFPFPRYSTSRLFLRQTFGLGGPTEKLDSDYGQLAGTYDVSRLTFQVGRFSVHDLFDTNDYAQDPRTDFLNWSIWASGAFDYAADKIGLTYGITAEWNEANWAARAGYFLVGNQPNSNVFDMSLFSTGSYNAELELRYQLNKHAGVAKFGGWMHETFTGNFNDALNLMNATGLDINTAITQVQHNQPMFGYYINLQQEIADDLGVFARWSWNDGQSQYSAFTDISSSLAAGVSIRGTRWNRPDDTVGIAGAMNFASSPLSSYLSQGGLGILVGDGALTYLPEQVVETYYSWKVTKAMTVTADYQLLLNPAYNQVRGPVNVFSGRLHLSF
ncbi:MAG: carbohydrate porin [Alphaproteobacteria bacterium]|nr:carbohydrate porin [Alphaproteobacteria bacterium]MBV8409903.1 carbohydrate porin [Alphaproteobacteria bacterium]